MYSENRPHGINGTCQTDAIPEYQLPPPSFMIQSINVLVFGLAMLVIDSAMLRFLFGILSFSVFMLFMYFDGIRYKNYNQSYADMLDAFDTKTLHNKVLVANGNTSEAIMSYLRNRPNRLFCD